MDDQKEKIAANLVEDRTTKYLVCQHCGLELAPGSTACPQHGPVLGAVCHEELLLKEFGGRYEFISLVSSGGMGVIYKAKQLLLNKDVAIKMLHSHLASEQAIARFQQEAKAASTLDHPGIITVHDFGISEHGQAYMVMDYVEGKPLSAVIEDEGQLDCARAFQIFIQICNAVEHAHSKGILHRDLKPSNIMISDTSDGIQTKLVDFGIAKIHDQISLTQTGDVLGSPPYMSPEQCRGHNIDRRSDIYALGCVMYEALTGHPPFTGASLVEIIFKQINEKPLSITKSRPDLKFPSALAQIINTTLEKDPNDRYQTVEKIRTDIEKLLSSQLSVKYVNRRRRRFFKLMVFLAIISWAISIALVLYKETSEKDFKKTRAELKQMIVESNKSHTLELMNLTIDDHKFDDRDLALLRGLKNLEVLNMRYTNITDDGLSNLSGLNNLKELRVSGTQVHGPGLIHLKSLPKLTALSLSELSISPNGLTALPELKHLKELHISQHPLSNETLEAVSQMQGVQNLEIKSAEITDEKFVYIARLQGLKSLDITYNKISDKSIPEILKLKHLTVLHMGANSVSDEGIKKLVALPNLTYVKVMGGDVTLKGLEGLRRLMPNCVID